MSALLSPWSNAPVFSAKLPGGGRFARGPSLCGASSACSSRSARSEVRRCGAATGARMPGAVGGEAGPVKPGADRQARQRFHDLVGPRISSGSLVTVTVDRIRIDSFAVLEGQDYNQE